MSYFGNTIDTDTLIQQAIDEVSSSYSDTVSVKQKKKSLHKWGENLQVGTSRATVMTLKSGVTDETLLSSNGITSFSSDSGSDTTQNLALVEGHTISGSNLTFSVSTPASSLTGTTNASLPVNLARITRARLSAPAVGNIYFHEGNSTSGVSPDAETHLIIPAGEIQSQKASTAISQSDYWFISRLSIGILEKTGSYIKARIEIKPVASGQDWYPLTTWFVATDSSGTVVKDFSPYKIVPKNYDVRVSALANTGSVKVVAGLDGFLASVQ